MAVSEIFANYGEPNSARLERSVIARLLDDPPQVLATGGGAFMDEAPAPRCGRAFTIWLKAPVGFSAGARSRTGQPGPC